MWKSSFLLAACLVIAAHAFGSGEDKFIKKYAMMKIYESCFGPEVVKQIRKEMKAACAKCSTMEEPEPIPQTPAPTVAMTTPPQPKPTPTQASPMEMHKNTVSDPDNAIYANQQSVDADKLHQAIFSYRPQNPFPQPALRPFSQVGYYPGYPQPNPAMYYPSPYPQPHPFGAPNPYGFPFGGAGYFGPSRMSREMNVRDQLDSLTNRMTGKVKNITCVMQELGYLDDNLEPNFEKIVERIMNLPVSEELKTDMQEGVEFCQQFSQCIPEVKREKSPLSRELIKPMFFFKCYKHKKLEACIMKDVRDKYTVGEDDFEEDVPIRRSGKDMKFQDREIDEMASSMYEFLYGGDSSLDLESVF